MSDASFYSQLKIATNPEKYALLNTPLIQLALAGEMCRDQYIAFLSQAYHHVKETTPLMIQMMERLDESIRWLLPALQEYAEEERGHEMWVLNDIGESGGAVDIALTSRPNPSTESLIANAYYQIEHQNPVGFFGMVHVLEGTSVGIASQAADAIQRSTGLPDGAFTYLRSHGSLDTEHVRHFATLIERFVHKDRAYLVESTRRFFVLYRQMFEEIHSTKLMRQSTEISA